MLSEDDIKKIRDDLVFLENMGFGPFVDEIQTLNMVLEDDKIPAARICYEKYRVFIQNAPI